LTSETSFSIEVTSLDGIFSIVLVDTVSTFIEFVRVTTSSSLVGLVGSSLSVTFEASFSIEITSLDGLISIVLVGSVSIFIDFVEVTTSSSLLGLVSSS